MPKAPFSVHPIADIFALIPDEEFAELVESVSSSGLREPIKLDHSGTVLVDGRNRLRACEQAGVEPKFERLPESTDLVAYIIDVNIRRRHLTTGQRAMLALDILPMIEEQQTDKGGRPAKPPADRPEVSKPKPSRAERESRHKAAKLTGTSGRALGRAKRVAEHAPDLVEEVKSGQRSLDDAHSEASKRQKKAKFLKDLEQYQAEANKKGDQFVLHHADFRDALADLEPGSVDAIITDPPYPDEFLPLWGDLAEVAARVLRPGAPLIAWSGQFRLRQVLNYLCEHLTYQWTICLDLPGNNARFRGPNMIQTWKPIIICTAGQWGPHDWFQDRVTSPGKDQALYEWQQNPDPAVDLIERYVPLGGLIVDPFMGVGSFGVAALSSGRRFIGCEVHEYRYNQSLLRLGRLP
jgi:ParB-like chromosome segregation protein Spo0J